MQPRKWIVVSLFLLLVIGAVSLWGVRELEKSRGLERILAERISPLMGGEFRVESVRFGFFSLYLSNVNLSIPLRAFKLHVRDIKAGISFKKLFQTRGDFGRSISSIIFIDPIIDFTTVSQRRTVEKILMTGQPAPLAGGFPVERFLIRNGAVRINGSDTNTLALGEQLNGFLQSEPRGVLRFELRGRMGSLRRNLVLEGRIATDSSFGQATTLSLHLEKARLNRPLQLQAFTIEAGEINGACEVSFGDMVRPEGIVAQGRMTITAGRITAPGLPGSINRVGAVVTFDSSLLHIDSCSAAWSGVRGTGTGCWDFAGKTRCYAGIRLEGITTDLLPAEVSQEICRSIIGVGWSDVAVTKEPGAKFLTAHALLGGFTILGMPLTRCEGFVRLEQNVAAIDSFFIETPQVKFASHGLINYEKAPVVYSFDCKANLGADVLLAGAGGKIDIAGTVSGLGAAPTVSTTMCGHDLVFQGVSLGNPVLAVTSESTGLRFGTVSGNDAGFTISGFVDSLSIPQPKFEVKLALANRTTMAVLRGLPFAVDTLLDSARFVCSAVGIAHQWTALGALSLQGEKLSGTLGVRFSRSNSDPRISWRIDGQKLSLNHRATGMVAEGMVGKDSISIDTLATGLHIGGRGTVPFADSVAMQLVLNISAIPLQLIDTLCIGGDGVLSAGSVSGKARITGSRINPCINAAFRARGCVIGGVGPIETDVVISRRDSTLLIQPFVVRDKDHILAAVDTLRQHDSTLTFRGEFYNILLQQFLRESVPDDAQVGGSMSGSFQTTGTGFPVTVLAHSSRIGTKELFVDSIKAAMLIDGKGIRLDSLTARDSTRLTFKGDGYIPWPFLFGTEGDADTMSARLRVDGDLLVAMAHHYNSPIGGRGRGSVRLAFTRTVEELHFSEAFAEIPRGVLTIYPFVPDEITNFTFAMALDDSSRLHTTMSGLARKRPVSIISTHDIPPGCEPFMFGSINAGVFRLLTPQKGMDIHVLGLLEPGARADVEFTGRGATPAFTLAGPNERPKLSGTMIVRNTELTFPFLTSEVLPWDFDPFPFINWDLDLVAGDRKVNYFYDVGIKQRRLIRFVDCSIDMASSILKIRGIIEDKTFAIYGTLHSYKGEAYYGKVFNRDLDVGIDFDPLPLPRGEGFDNTPIIWGTAEAFSDSSRFDRIKITLVTRDPETGGLAERGRAYDISFKLSSDFDERPGESEREFYKQAGLKFTTFGGAGEFVGNFGEQFLHRYFFQRLERQLAKRLGLDVITFETSIASNYFYYLNSNSSQSHDLSNQLNYLAFANVGITVGRYFLKDKFFLKWRTEFVPVADIILPEHSLGLELYPVRYLMFDLNYGFYRGEKSLQHNPEANIQLRLPIGGIRKKLNM
jgi:hypothetical protein